MPSNKLDSWWAGPWKKGTLGQRQRLQAALKWWCAARGVAPSESWLALGEDKAWPKDVKQPSRSWAAAIATCAKKGSLPQGQRLTALCRVLGVSTDWVDTGTGPHLARAVAAGATRDATTLADELAAYLEGAVAYHEDWRAIAVTVDGAVVLNFLTSALVRIAQRWRLDAMAAEEHAHARQVLGDPDGLPALGALLLEGSAPAGLLDLARSLTPRPR